MITTATPAAKQGQPSRGRRKFTAADVGYRIGRSRRPRGVDLYVPYDRTGGVIGPQGSGKTLDLLFPALLDAPGGALVTLTKPSDLLLVFDDRRDGGRPGAVLDPFGLVPSLPQLVWDPVAGCADPMLARRRAQAFAAGTAGAATHGDDAAVFYQAQCANVLQCLFHAAALTGRTLDDILGWVANPATAGVADTILTTHPYAAPHWAGMLDKALHGDPKTSANTTATVHQAMDILFQPSIRARCVPTPGNPPTDLRELIAERGTLYLLGRDDPYLSAAPMMTAVAEDVLDTVLDVAYTSPHGRLTPPWLSVLDELPSTAPLPTLATRMANDRALGSGFLWAAQTWPQLITLFGPTGAAQLLGLTNTLITFGGGNNNDFNSQIADLIGVRQQVQRNYSGGGGRDSWSTTTHDVQTVRAEQIRAIPERQALVIADRSRPILADLHRCIDGARGRQLLANQDRRRSELAAVAPGGSYAHRAALTDQALSYTRKHGLAAASGDAPVTPATEDAR